MTWVITTNSSSCHIYNYDKIANQITLVKEIAHPENRQKSSEVFTSDKPGHYQSSSTAHGTYAPHTDPKKVAIDQFSREIANELDHGRTANLYKQLIIIAPPQMSGLLYQHLNKHVIELVRNNIHKDMPHLKAHELIHFLKTHAQFPDAT